MGTARECTRHLFTTLLKNNCAVITKIFHSRDFPVTFNNRLPKVGIQTGSNWLQESMDKLSEQYIRETIRNTMLKHEETFKQQVDELHRLYRVQKMLMSELRTKEVKCHSPGTVITPTAVADARTRFWSSPSASETSHSSYFSNRYHSTSQLNSEYISLHQCSSLAGPSPLEVSRYSEGHLRMQKGIDLELPAEKETDTVVVDTQDQTMLWKHSKEKINMEGRDLRTEGESDVELTLSIGPGSDRKKMKQRYGPIIGIGCSKPTPSETGKLILSTPEREEEGNDSSPGFEKETLKRPHWLLQALSLNRT